MRLSKELYLSKFVAERLMAGYSYLELYQQYNRSDVLYYCGEIRNALLRLLTSKYESVLNFSLDYGISHKLLQSKAVNLDYYSFVPAQNKVFEKYKIASVSALSAKYELIICSDLDGVSTVTGVSKLGIIKDILESTDSALIATANNLSMKSLANANYDYFKEPSIIEYLEIFKKSGFKAKVYFPYPNHIAVTEIFSEKYPIRNSQIYNSNLNLEVESLELLDENILVDHFYKLGISNQLTNSFIFWLDKV